MLRQPLAADVLHHGVAGLLGRPEDVLDQRSGPARVQLHRQQVGRPQLAARQVGFDLTWTEKTFRDGSAPVRGLDVAEAGL